jgi:hypothetical protein
MAMSAVIGHNQPPLLAYSLLMMRGPTLSPVSLLCFTCAALQGNCTNTRYQETGSHHRALCAAMLCLLYHTAQHIHQYSRACCTSS